MPNNNVYLEVRSLDGAILSYFLERPTTQSDTVDYVEATWDELTYLSALEDNILPSGAMASLTHLESHRKRVEAAKASKVSHHTTAPQKVAQKPSQSATAANTKPDSSAVRSFKSGFKPVNNPRK